MIVDKDYRITLPKNIFTSFSADDFVEVAIGKSNIRSSFYLRIPRKCPSRKYLQVRRRLPKEVSKYLEIKPFDDIELIEIKKINKINTEAFKDNHFDVLSLNLEGVMVDLFSKDGQDWVRFWSSSKNGGITNFVELKRSIPINKKIGEFFGLMQAESNKRGKKFGFTNIFLSEHRLFIEVAEQLGIRRNKWSIGVIYNPKLSETEIVNANIHFIKKLSLDKYKVYVSKSQTITKFAYQIAINSVILNKVMNVTLRKLRTESIKLASQNQNFKEFCKGFLLKVLLGDGSVTFPSSQNMQIHIMEPDKEAQNDLVKICRFFNISTNVQGIRLYLSADFESVVWYLKNGAFLGHEKNRRKLEEYAGRNYYFRTLEQRLKTINLKINSRKFAEINNIKLPAAKRYLERSCARGYINKSKNNRYNLYEINEKGKEFLRIISALK